jgi:hypothetical protein
VGEGRGVGVEVGGRLVTVEDGIAVGMNVEVWVGEGVLVSSGETISGDAQPEIKNMLMKMAKQGQIERVRDIFHPGACLVKGLQAF